MARVTTFRRSFVIKRKLTEQEQERSRHLRCLFEAAAQRRREEAVAPPPKPKRPASRRARPAQPQAHAGQLPDPHPGCPQFAAQSDRTAAAPTPPASISAVRDPKSPKPSQKAPKLPKPSKPVKSPRPTTSRRQASRPRPLKIRHKVHFDLPPAEPTPRPTPLRTAEEGFYVERQVLRCTKPTMDGYKHDVALIVRWLEAHGVTEPGQITAPYIRLFLQEVDACQVTAWTLHRYARTVRAFCNFMLREELITRSPMAKVRMPRLPKELQPAFTVEEIQGLLDAAGRSDHIRRDTALILALLDTGCRLEEFLKLTLADIDLQTGRVFVRQGKGGKDRITFMGTRCLTAVRTYLDDRPTLVSDAPLWLNSRGEKLTRDGLRGILRRLAEVANLTDVHPHKFRRTFALWSLRAGMNIYSLQILMGHSDLKTLQRYLALVEADLEQQHREHGAVDAVL